MPSVKDFQILPANDYFKKNVYYFDSFLSRVLKVFLENQTDPKFSDLHNCKNAIELTNKILKLEHITDVNVYENNLDSICKAYYYEISFSKNSISDQEVAFHEISHIFDTIYSATPAPAHYVGFLAILEYFLDKYDFICKEHFEIIVTQVALLYNKPLPYISDFLSITDHDLSDYESILFSLNNNQYSKYEHHSYLPYSYLSKVIFEANDHYVTLLINKNNTKTFQKIIQKKLPLEMNKKFYDLVISPIFFVELKDNAFYLSTKKENKFTHLAFEIGIKSDKIEIKSFVSMIQKELISVHKLPLVIVNEDDYSINVSIDSNFLNHNKKEFYNLIKPLFNFLKEKNITYYKSKNIMDFRYKLNNFKDIK